MVANLIKKLLIVTTVVGSFVLLTWSNTFYTRHECMVVSYKEDIVVAEDKNGNLWEFQADGLEIGDVVNLQMATNGTEENIYDDEVLDFKLVKDYREN